MSEVRLHGPSQERGAAATAPADGERGAFGTTAAAGGAPLASAAVPGDSGASSPAGYSDVLLKHLQCSICFGFPAGGPAHLRSLKSCGHTYCLPCITEWFRRSKTCPACRSPQSTDPQPLPSMMGHLFEVVRSSCPLQCGAVLLMSNLDAHMTAQCPERPVTCSGCESELRATEVSKHSTEDCNEALRTKLASERSRLRAIRRAIVSSVNIARLDGDAATDAELLEHLHVRMRQRRRADIRVHAQSTRSRRSPAVRMPGGARLDASPSRPVNGDDRPPTRRSPARPA